MTQARARLTAKDLDKMQEAFPDYQMELVGGQISVMSPSGIESDEVATEIAAQLRNWVRPRKLGRVIGSSGGYILPNEDEDIRAPDVSFIKAVRMIHPTQDYAEIVPDLMFEVVSKSNSLKKLRAKIQQFLDLGTLIGILVDPRTRLLEIYRDRDKLTLSDGDILTLPEILPGWEMEIASIWAPDFSDQTELEPIEPLTEEGEFEEGFELWG